MSCSLCRLPFTPNPTSVDPHGPPPGILTDKQLVYFRYAVSMGKNCMPGCLVNMTWFDNNLFGNAKPIPVVTMVAWEADGGTILVVHTACATILRHIFGATDDSNKSVADLCEIELVVGRPLPGPDAGRLPGLDYEKLGDEKVDLRPFWRYKPGCDGSLSLDWHLFMKSGLDWTLKRPDVFPKFHGEVSAARLAVCSAPQAAQTDLLTNLPNDLLYVLLPFLTTRAFFALLSTCRFLRSHALTTLQPQARARVLELGWSVPVPAERAKVPESVRAVMASPERDGDWFLYLSQIHRSGSLRVRRWIWAIASDVRRIYVERKTNSEYADIVVVDEVNGGTKRIKSKARIALEKQVGLMGFMRNIPPIRTTSSFPLGDV